MEHAKKFEKGEGILRGDIAAAKSLDKYINLECEYREFANTANKLKKISEIRPHLHCTERSAVQVFAFFGMGIKILIHLDLR